MRIYYCLLETIPGNYRTSQSNLWLLFKKNELVINTANAFKYIWAEEDRFFNQYLAYRIIC